jgi:murein DD-endopeptidase MepM/ murein hydrolase activator NlpD
VQGVSRIFLLFGVKFLKPPPVAWGVLLVLLVAGCTSGVDSPPQITQTAPIAKTVPAHISDPTQVPLVFPTDSRSNVELPAPTSENLPQVCSPLLGLSLSQLGERISNPFNPPRSGSDDPHQGIDLVDMDSNNLAREGSPVSAVLKGKVAASITDRFPYGNALLIETVLEGMPREWVEQLNLPAPGISPEVVPALTCPVVSATPEWNLESTSLYLLYAHLQRPSELRVGDVVECGQVIGAIGSSGNALNPHLHLEVRSGPFSASFESMAHYDASASLEEMAAYCTWRVSGSFPLVDPMSLFSWSP